MKIAAADIGGTAIKYGLYSQDGTCLKFAESPTDTKNGGAALIRQVGDLLESLGGAQRIGISTAGQVDPKTGTILFATDTIPGYTGTPVKRLLEERFQIPAAVENDVNSAALGEAHFGAARAYPDFLCLTYGTGIGGAIIRGGEIEYGATFSAGEFGHLITHAGGKPCTCASRGCYEQYASTRALCALVKEKTEKSLNGREIFHIIEDNDIVAQCVAQWKEEIVQGLASLVHIFNPACIVLAGGIMNQPGLVESLEAQLKEWIMPNYRGVRLMRSSLGSRAGTLGAVYRAATPECQGSEKARF